MKKRMGALLAALRARVATDLVVDDATARAVRAFQIANGLGVTGRVDRITWNRMAEQYDMSVAGGH